MASQESAPGPHVGPTQPAGMTLQDMGMGRVGPTEVWWRAHYSWLLEHGFQLCERYKPDWVPSWKGRDPSETIKCEDGQASRVGRTLALETSTNLTKTLVSLGAVCSQCYKG